MTEIKEEWDIEEIRKAMAELQHNLAWYSRRGGLLPYDWDTYGSPHTSRLLKLLKIDLQGYILKQDKRGYWSIRKC
jgi:hypothetical protein